MSSRHGGLAGPERVRLRCIHRRSVLVEGTVFTGTHAVCAAAALFQLHGHGTAKLSVNSLTRWNTAFAAVSPRVRTPRLFRTYRSIFLRCFFRWRRDSDASSTRRPAESFAGAQPLPPAERCRPSSSVAVDLGRSYCPLDLLAPPARYHRSRAQRVHPRAAAPLSLNLASFGGPPKPSNVPVGPIRLC